MIKRYAFILSGRSGALARKHRCKRSADQCGAGTSLVNNGLWNAPTVPPTMTGYLTTTTLALTNTATVSSAAGLSIGTIVNGPELSSGYHHHWQLPVLRSRLVTMQ
ncbi:MAG: hypothetical protein IPI81_05170 [Flavobacteriales bacterium]|nr:hypothetical protein [Flavobacteriales bacterium]